MSISSTNRIYDPRRALRHVVAFQVAEMEAEKRKSGRRNLRWFMRPLAICSKCHRKFDAKIAKKQIANKRKNAPICIPCIMGRKRRKVPINKLAFYKPEFQEVVKKFYKKNDEKNSVARGKGSAPLRADSH